MAGRFSVAAPLRSPSAAAHGRANIVPDPYTTPSKTGAAVPKRVKRAGYKAKLPPNTKMVARPTRWANPFRIGHEARDHSHAQAMFRDYLDEHPELVERARNELTGYDLACYCDLDKPCHADV